MIDLSALISKQIAFVESQIKEAKHVRDTAATPTESHSDKTRQTAEQLMDSLTDEKRRLDFLGKTLKSVPPFNTTAQLNSLVTLRTPLGLKDFLLVPEGLGGKTVNNIYLLAENTPLASNFLNRKTGFTFSFNGGAYELVRVLPNT